MIVVEGPDGAGKTTLIDYLREELNLPVAERVVSKDTKAMVNLKAWTEDNVNRGWQATIFDRHRLISEPIYGALMRKAFEPGFDDFQWFYMMNYMFYKNCRPVIIYCLPPWPIVEKNIANDPDNRAIAPKIRRIYQLYLAKAAYDCVNHGARVYDYTQDSPQEIALWVNSCLVRMEHDG